MANRCFFSFFYSEHVGSNYIWKEKQQSLWKLSGILWILFFGLSQFLPVSRRSTNLVFCVWATAHNVLILAIFQKLINSTKIWKQSPIPLGFEQTNKFGLFVFLAANLLTGLVNLTIPTLDVSNDFALLIVFGYICVLGISPVILRRI